MSGSSESFGFDVIDLSGATSPSEKRHVCVDCRVASPPTHTNFTLISARFGWRLHRQADPVTGEWIFEWRCPDCWARFRGRAPSSSRSR